MRIPYFRLELEEGGGYFELFWWLGMIAGSNGKSGQPGGGWKTPKMAAQGATATAPIFWMWHEVERQKW